MNPCLPNWKMNLNSKNGTKRSFSYETKASTHLSQWVEWIYAAQSLKERRLLSESIFIPIERWTLILKKVETKVFLVKPIINSFIPMSRMNLWCPIIKRKEIIMWIHVYPNWKINFNSKKRRNKSFSYEINHQFIYPNE